MNVENDRFGEKQREQKQGVNWESPAGRRGCSSITQVCDPFPVRRAYAS
jgi:hypothetical protein